jgi:hypothetical protein
MYTDESTEHLNYDHNNNIDYIQKIEEDFANYDLNVSSLSKMSQLPDNIECIKVIEKNLDGNNSNHKLVKKEIQFKDGTYEAVLYNK